MLVLIPHLFPPDRLRDVATPGIAAPGLATLLRRGHAVASPVAGVEGALCHALGVARQQDWPVAPMTLHADEIAPDDAYWLRADPVHLRVMRDRIVLAAPETPDLTRPEAEALADAVRAHFAGELELLTPHPRRWYVRLDAVPTLVTTPPSLAVGCDIAPRQPSGSDAPRLRALINELQMLLYAHPINQARTAQGRLAVNSLWLWGGGRAPEVKPVGIWLYTDAEDLAAVGRHCGARRAAVPPSVADMRFSDGDVLVLEHLVEAGQYGDALGWRAALARLEVDWFAPLLTRLRELPASGIQIADPVNGVALRLGRRAAWRFWQRAAPLAPRMAQVIEAARARDLPEASRRRP